MDKKRPVDKKRPEIHFFFQKNVNMGKKRKRQEELKPEPERIQLAVQEKIKNPQKSFETIADEFKISKTTLRR